MDIDKMKAGPEMDAHIAVNVMGWTRTEIEVKPADFGGGWYTKKYLVDLNGNVHPAAPYYSTDIAAAWVMEERIAELGLIEEYCFQLNAIANLHKDRDYCRHPQRWQLIHATPEDRCRAALKVTSREESSGAVNG